MSEINRIYDAVYGYIELNEVEFALVNSPIFQRLHWIKQLGPLHTIFPSAQHSRFSHSIGVFHIIGKMIKRLQMENSGYKGSLSEDDLEALKIAAILHDIGHVPLSHVGEIVLKDSFEPETGDKHAIAGDKPKKWTDLFDSKYVGDSTKLHELLSVEIVLQSLEIDKILKRVKKGSSARKKMRETIAKIIAGQHENQIFRALLHSELDADRLDYLLRDSFFTGVGYGYIDLDYIISRIIVAEDNGGEQQLCFEAKGLHTIEHYILGRFFLQTQVIFNRKVRFLDLVFADVMKHMIENKTDCKGKVLNFHIMDLRELLDGIRHNKDDKIGRDFLHKLYAYTDAEVFAKMRVLHEMLQQKKEDKIADENEKYINDCIKIIMDGDVPDPVGGTHQRLVPIRSLDDKADIKKLKKESEQIAGSIASKSGNKIYRERIKHNISEQSVMKYSRNKEKEEDRKEAVRITYPKVDGSDEVEVKHAANSNATILGDLVDKTLLVFNVYYVRSKSEDNDELVAHKESVIKKGFSDFVSEHFEGGKMACGCDNGPHLCQMFFDENGIERLKELGKDSKFICSRCGRTSSSKDTLCKAVPL